MTLNQFTIFESHSYEHELVQEAILSLLERKDHNPDYKEIIPVAKNSISIGEIRDIISWLQLKPFQSPNKVVVIASAEKLTLEAQNCLLKTLETPPANSYIFLITKNPQTLLPTVRSRGTLIRVQRQKSTTMPETQTKIRNLLKSNLKTQIAWIDTIAKITDNFEKRNRVLQFLLEVHNIALEGTNPSKVQQNLQLIAKSQEAVSRNVNIKLILENFLFNYQAN